MVKSPAGVTFFQTGILPFPKPLFNFQEDTNDPQNTTPTSPFHPEKRSRRSQRNESWWKSDITWLKQFLFYYHVSLLYTTCDESMVIYFVVVTSDVIVLIFSCIVVTSFFDWYLGTQYELVEANFMSKLSSTLPSFQCLCNVSTSLVSWKSKGPTLPNATVPPKKWGLIEGLSADHGG